MQYGGGCINEVCLHLMVKGAPFNGTGHSGMGSYHGVWGFREFTHPSTVLYGHSHFNLSLREHPYSDKKLRKIKKNQFQKEQRCYIMFFVGRARCARLTMLANGVTVAPATLTRIA